MDYKSIDLRTLVFLVVGCYAVSCSISHNGKACSCMPQAIGHKSREFLHIATSVCYDQCFFNANVNQ